MQKRKIVAFVAFLLLVGAGAANAATGTATINAGATYSGRKGSEATLVMGRLSTNVSAIFNFTTTSYAVNTHHLNGTKEYGSSDGDTNVYSHDRSAGSTLPDAPAAAGSASYTDTSWSSL